MAETAFKVKDIEVEIVSYKEEKTLWYQNPGAHVECGHCGTIDERQMGWLAPKPNKPHSTWDQFFCRYCKWWFEQDAPGRYDRYLQQLEAPPWGFHGLRGV